MNLETVFSPAIAHQAQRLLAYCDSGALERFAKIDLDRVARDAQRVSRWFEKHTPPAGHRPPCTIYRFPK